MPAHSVVHQNESTKESIEVTSPSINVVKAAIAAIIGGVTSIIVAYCIERYRPSFCRILHVNKPTSNNVIDLDVRKGVLQKFKENAYSSVKDLPEDENDSIVILLTGSYRLPHLSHLQIGLTVYNHLVEAGYTNVKMMFSPSHQSYITMKCQQHKNNEQKKGSSYLVEPTREQRVNLLKALIKNALEKKIITKKQYQDMEVNEDLEKDSFANWNYVAKKLRSNMSYKKVIYVSGSDLIDNNQESLIDDHIAFKRDLIKGVSSTNIINDKKLQKQLKEELPDYYKVLKDTFANLNL